MVLSYLSGNSCADSATLLCAFAAHAESRSSSRLFSQSDGSHSDKPIFSRQRRYERKSCEQSS